MKRTTLKNKHKYVLIIKHNTGKHKKYIHNQDAKQMFNKIIPGLSTIVSGSYYDSILYSKPIYYKLTRHIL